MFLKGHAHLPAGGGLSFSTIRKTLSSKFSEPARQLDLRIRGSVFAVISDRSGKTTFPAHPG